MYGLLHRNATDGLELIRCTINISASVWWWWQYSQLVRAGQVWFGLVRAVDLMQADMNMSRTLHHAHTPHFLSSLSFYFFSFSTTFIIHPVFPPRHWLVCPLASASNMICGRAATDHCFLNISTIRVFLSIQRVGLSRSYPDQKVHLGEKQSLRTMNNVLRKSNDNLVGGRGKFKAFIKIVPSPEGHEYCQKSWNLYLDQGFKFDIILNERSWQKCSSNHLLLLMNVHSKHRTNAPLPLNIYYVSDDQTMGPNYLLLQKWSAFYWTH